MICRIAKNANWRRSSSKNRGFLSGTFSAMQPIMNVRAAELRARVKQFAIRVVKFVRAFPSSDATRVLGNQLLKSGTGESANYHAACRARSRAEFIAKLGVVVEEADETEHWLDLIKASEIASGAELNWLMGEAAELRAIFRASLVTARANCGRDKKPGSRSTPTHRPSHNPEILKSLNP
jgi:four helix bundle protein